MKNTIRHILTILGISSMFFLSASARAQLTGEGEELAAQLKSVLEKYNKSNESDGDSDPTLGAFFIKRNLVTESLKAGLKRGGDFSADPFTYSQDVVAGFFTKKVQMGEEVARIEVGIKQHSEEYPPKMVTYILCKEKDGWKIDDIDYSETKINGMSLNMSTLKDALR